MSSSHLDRKELKQPDAFVTSSTSLFEMAQKNSKVLIALLIVAAAVITAVMFYQNSKATHEVEVANSFYSLRKTAVVELAKVANKDGKVDGDWEAKTKDTLAALAAFADQNRGTAAGFEAALMLGTTYFEHASYEKAAVYYAMATASAPSKTVEATARYELAYAYENLKKYDDALAAHEKIQASGVKIVTSDSLLAMARIVELKGDKKKALEYLEKFNKEYPESPVKKTVEATMARLKK